MPLPRTSWIALTLSLLLTIAFVAWAAQALNDESPLVAWDKDVARTFKEIAHDHHFRREVMKVMTDLGGIPAHVILALVGVVWQWRRGNKTLALAWALIIAGGGLLNIGLKTTLDRPRPPPEWRDRAVTETNESFPSGHSMGSVIGYGVLAYAACLAIRRRGWKIVLLVVLTLLVAGIGFSRIYLRAHWFSDVIGGFLIGAAWLSFGLAWTHALSRKRQLLDATTSLP